MAVQWLRGGAPGILTGPACMPACPPHTPRKRCSAPDEIFFHKWPIMRADWTKPSSAVAVHQRAIKIPHAPYPQVDECGRHSR